MSLTVREQSLVDRAKLMLPTNFTNKSSDDQMKAYIDVVLADINFHTPATSYDLNNMPTAWDPIVCYGAHIFANMFVQLGYALKDFGYSDYGLNLQIDRGGKIQAVTTQMLRAYERMIWNLKKQVLLNVGARGLATPRYASQVGQLLKSVYGSSFNWNSSPSA